MARLHKEFISPNGYHSQLKLTDRRAKDLQKSRDALREKIQIWFRTYKWNELQPKFSMQGSCVHGTAINPIPLKDRKGNIIREYDLDDGIYFEGKGVWGEKKNVQIYHDWVYQAVINHTGNAIKKKTCIRVVFSDGHHIDLPIYYVKYQGATPELADTSKGWIQSKPTEFTQWIKENCNAQTKRIVRYLKGWKNYREIKYSNIKLPSGFALTILVQKYYHKNGNDDVAFRETVRNILHGLKQSNAFKCYRPTTPIHENLFADYSYTRKKDFLDNLQNLLTACDRADAEVNFKRASEYLREQFGNRFPKGANETEQNTSDRLKKSIAGTGFKQKPYGSFE